MKKLLIIEDDRAFLETLKLSLEAEGYQVQAAEDGEQGFRLASKGDMDLILLDLMLPSMTGFEVCRKLREGGSQIPVIILSGQKKEEVDKVLGLELGADDYLIKPFGTRELVARIHAIFRRSRPEPPELEEYAFADIHLDFKKKTASKGKKEIYLTAKEFGLLKLLISHEGEVISRDTILNQAWGYEKFPTTRTIDTFIHNLRQKIEKDPSKPIHLITVPWSGYKFQK